jgi:hypothetical protein
VKSGSEIDREYSCNFARNIVCNWKNYELDGDRKLRRYVG